MFAQPKSCAPAIRGAPSQGTHLPGILHIHGGGQTASLEWVRFWTSRGYVCTTYDFTGPWAGRKEVTDWGPIKQGNLAQRLTDINVVMLDELGYLHFIANGGTPVSSHQQALGQDPA